MKNYLFLFLASILLISFTTVAAAETTISLDYSQSDFEHYVNGTSVLKTDADNLALGVETTVGNWVLGLNYTESQVGDNRTSEDPSFLAIKGGYRFDFSDRASLDLTGAYGWYDTAWANGNKIEVDGLLLGARFNIGLTDAFSLEGSYARTIDCTGTVNDIEYDDDNSYIELIAVKINWELNDNLAIYAVCQNSEFGFDYSVSSTNEETKFKQNFGLGVSYTF